MNKLALAFATAATLGLSTAAFAQNHTASTIAASTQDRALPMQSKAPVVHNIRASHRANAKTVAVAHHRHPHRKVLHARHPHRDKGKKVIVNAFPPIRLQKQEPPRNIPRTQMAPIAWGHLCDPRAAATYESAGYRSADAFHRDDASIDACAIWHLPSYPSLTQISQHHSIEPRTEGSIAVPQWACSLETLISYRP